MQRSTIIVRVGPAFAVEHHGNLCLIENRNDRDSLIVERTFNF
jgi:hypothetical protein